MLAALVVFARLWWVTPSPSTPPAPPPRPGPSQKLPPPPTGRADAERSSAGACRTADQAIEAVLQAPEDAAALATAGQLVRTCTTLSPRACEAGPALDAREPLGAPGPGALRGLLAGLCERCPAPMHPCTGLFLRGLQSLEDAPLAGMRWNLEHAGAGATVACEALARDLVVPVASAHGKASAAAHRAFESLVPVCLRHDLLPSPLLHAAVVNRRLGGAAPAKADLFERALATGTHAVYVKLAPDEVLGAAAGARAFDGNERSGVDLGNGAFGQWDSDGALRAQYAQPLAWLGGVRVRAKGPGTLRAIVRLEGTGLEDAVRKTRYVNPTVCHFKGTGSWEECRLPLPLRDVEAVSVFPGRERISLQDVEVLGARER